MSPHIPGFERFEEIGLGGFSRVYKAWEPEFKRQVAIKVLKLDGNQSFDRDIFRSECQSLGAMSGHPHIVEVYASGFTSSGAPFLSMQLCDKSLLDRLKSDGVMAPDAVLDLGVKMAAALHRAHQGRLLHRDIKPHNIFFSFYGEPVLGDFGIASLVDYQPQERIGMTVMYAAPEVLQGQTPRVESDFYSLGATLYTALAGRRPFEKVGDESDESHLHRIRTEVPPPIDAQRVPDAVMKVILGLMAKSPTDRPRQARDVGELFRGAQVQLGLSPTTMVLPSVDPVEDDTTIAGSRSKHRVLDFTTPSAASDVAVDDRTSATRTGKAAAQLDDDRSVYRQKAPDDGTDRLLLAGAAVVVVVLLAGVGVFLATRGGEADNEEAEGLDLSSTTTLVLTEQVALTAPSAVSLVDAGSSLELSWLEVADARSYRVDFLSGNQDSEMVGEPSLVLDRTEVDLPVCVEVRAVGDGGRLSPPSDRVCGP